MNVPSMMKVIEARSADLSDLTLAERPVPKTGPGEILIKVRAASLNYRDVVVVKGLYKPNIGYPFVPLSDASGDVVAAGEGVTRFKLGDAVLPTFIRAWPCGLPGRHSTALGIGLLDLLDREPVGLGAGGRTVQPGVVGADGDLLSMSVVFFMVGPLRLVMTRSPDRGGGWLAVSRRRRDAGHRCGSTSASAGRVRRRWR